MQLKEKFSPRLLEYFDKIQVPFSRSQANNIKQFIDSELNNYASYFGSEDQKSSIDFMTDLKIELMSSFPKLTEKDIDICHKTLIGLSNKEIATSHGIAASSIKMAKTRIKKKMGLEPEVDLKQFLYERVSQKQMTFAE